MALMGCTREPSEVDIRRIIALSIKEDMSPLMEKTYFGIQFGDVLGINQLKINEIEKISCAPIVDNKVTCQVLVDFEFVNKKDGFIEALGGVPKTRRIMEYQFVNLHKGWQVIGPVHPK
jgi:hypothetical protein